MTETQGNGLLKHPELQEQKERLSDGELGNLISAVGNNEAKAITLLAMRSGQIFSKGELHSQILNLQRKNIGWRMNRQNPLDYCLNSLSPIGLVAKETLNPDLSVWGYAITEYGQEIGIPFAGLILDFSERHRISLNKLFGATTSTSSAQALETGKEKVEFKKRAPITTLRVIYEIVTYPSLPVRDIDIQKQIGEKESTDVQHSFERLKEVGLVGHKSIEVNKRFSAYKFSGKLPEGKLPLYKYYKTLTNPVFAILQANPGQYLTNESIYNLLPRAIKDKWQNKERLLSRLSIICFHLAKNNYAEVEQFNHSLQSEVNISEEQRAILAELLEITDNVQTKNKEMLEKGRRLAEQIISSPKRVSEVMRRAKEASGHANKRPWEETKKDILSFLYLHPGLTNKQILDLLKKGGRVLSIDSVRGITRSLEKDSSARVEKIGSVKQYFPLDKS